MSSFEGFESIAGRVVWVTGAGSGIGRSIAIAFAHEGCHVAISGRRVDALRETMSVLEGFGARALMVPADVSDADDVNVAHQAIVLSLGEVDILVNNAGTNSLRRYWRDLSPADMGHVVDVNLKGPFLCSLAVLPAMRTSGRGTLIHIVSNAAAGIFPGVGPVYTASKHGARAMSATINAEEGIHGIRSVCINPGAVATPFQDLRPNAPAQADLALMVQPDDIAASAIFAARFPARACIAELLVTPTDNHIYREGALRIKAASTGDEPTQQ